MLIRLNSAVSCGGLAFEAGNVVDWRDHDPKQPDATAKRFVEKGLAEAVDPKELPAGAQIKKYTEPAPAPKRPVRGGDAA